MCAQVKLREHTDQKVHAADIHVADDRLGNRVALSPNNELRALESPR